MESNQPASQEESRLGEANENKSEERRVELRESNVEVGKPASPDVSSGMADEFFRLIRTLIEVKPKPSKLQVILNSTLVSVLAGFLLTGGIGTYLTYYYGKQQQELAARRSFSDELNKTRIQRFGEVWERIDGNELTIEGLLYDSQSFCQMLCTAESSGGDSLSLLL